MVQPQRSTTGFDTKKIEYYAYCFRKRCGFRLGVKDVFLNITGGIKPDDTSYRFKVICSILSSDQDFTNRYITCFSKLVSLGK